VALLVSLLLYFVEYYNNVTLPTSSIPAEFYSNQSQNTIEKTIVTAIKEAKKSIFLIIYALTDGPVISALREKAQQGVEVLVVCDYKASPDAPRRLGDKVKTIKRVSDGIMHQKILVIDEKQTWIGSANMTGESLKLHGNLMIGIESEAIGEMAAAKAKSFASQVFQPFIHRNFKLKDQLLEFWFLPDNTDGVQKIISLIDQAKKSIRIAMFTWTRRDFAHAVIAAHRRGVDVQVVIDRNSGNGSGEEIANMLCQSGVPTYFSQGRALLHYKLMEIDETILVNGSANWTNSAFKYNDDCFIILNPLTDDQGEFMNSLWKNILSDAKKCK
jgi:phosphatidylserine/phosphatidylglycerophosphate/cardiolipin synthase-like enzyme